MRFVTPISELVLFPEVPQTSYHNLLRSLMTSNEEVVGKRVEGLSRRRRKKRRRGGAEEEENRRRGVEEKEKEEKLLYEKRVRRVHGVPVFGEGRGSLPD